MCEGQRRASGVLLYYSLSHLLSQSFSLNLELGRQPANPAPSSSPVSAPEVLGNRVVVGHARFIHERWGTELRFSHLHKYSYE